MMRNPSTSVGVEIVGGGIRILENTASGSGGLNLSASDSRYVFTSSFNTYTASLDSRYVLTSSFTASYMSQSFTNQTSIDVVHNFGNYPLVQVFDSNNAQFLPKSIVQNTVNDFTITFDSSTSGLVIASLGSFLQFLSYNQFTASINSFTASISMASSTFAANEAQLLSASSSFAANPGITQAAGDLRYETTASFNIFSGTILSFTASMNAASSSFAATTVQLISASSSFASNEAQLLAASSSFANVSSSYNSLSSSYTQTSASYGAASSSFATSIGSLNTFSASFSASVTSINNEYPNAGFTFVSSSEVLIVNPARIVGTGRETITSGRVIVSGVLKQIEPGISQPIADTRYAPINAADGGFYSIFPTETVVVYPGRTTITNREPQTFGRVIVNGTIRQIEPGISQGIGDNRYVLLSSSTTQTIISFLIVSGNIYISGNISAPSSGALSEHFGAGSIASGSNSLAVGSSASAGAGVGNVSIGSNALTQVYNYSTAIGYNSVAIGGSDVALGTSAQTQASGGIAIGFQAFINGPNSIAVGDGASCSGSNAMAFGFNATTSTYNNALAIGSGSNVFGNNMGAIGSPLENINTTLYGAFSASSLTVTGTINSIGSLSTDLILTSSATSQITISGNLNILGYIQQSNLSSFTASMIQASSSFANVSSSYNSLSSSYTQVSGNFGTLSSSFTTYINNLNIFSASINGFTASFSASVKTIAVGSVNGYSGSLTIVAGPNITIASGSNQIVITGSGGGGSATGSDNFFVTNTLKVSGTIINTTGDLLLSSSSTSQVTISGNLNILGGIGGPFFTSSITSITNEYPNAGFTFVSSSEVIIVNSARIVQTARESITSGRVVISGVVKQIEPGISQPIADTRYLPIAGANAGFVFLSSSEVFTVYANRLTSTSRQPKTAGRVFVNGLLRQIEPGISQAIADLRYASSGTQVTGAGNFFVNNQLLVTGSISNGVGDLILSASNNNRIISSGVLNIKNNSIKVGTGNDVLTLVGNEYFVISPTAGNASYLMNRPLVSNYASADWVTAGNISTGWSMQMQPNLVDWYLLDRTANVYRLAIATTTGTIYAPATYMVLSSSVGSQITVSGNFSALGAGTNTPLTFVGSGSVLNLVSGSLGINVSTSGSYPLDVEGAIGNTVCKFGDNLPIYTVENDPVIGFNSFYSSSFRFGKGSNGTQYAGYLDFAPTAARFIFGISNAPGFSGSVATINNPLNISGSGVVYGSPLILSSSAGSVVVSGNLSVLGSVQTGSYIASVFLSAALTGNISLSGSNTFYSGAFVTLTSGTWNVMAGITIFDSVGSSQFASRISDGIPNVYAATEQATGKNAGGSDGMFLNAFVKCTSSLNVYVCGAAIIGSVNSLIVTGTQDLGQKPATYINAIRIA